MGPFQTDIYWALADRDSGRSVSSLFLPIFFLLFSTYFPNPIQNVTTATDDQQLCTHICRDF
ncbi:hypothetical protein QC762_0085610 [Podospora pseudocomata]|uniref:Uncharacterized protein n=1 Tax=Podospora pseudocomata TaxID=2093779 RepID=A0ABR0GD01_9PEZI|nr:hypothetical protein QC762_0085610 [Podospora pseudocomata]